MIMIIKNKTGQYVSSFSLILQTYMFDSYTSPFLACAWYRKCMGFSYHGLVTHLYPAITWQYHK